MVWNQNLLLGGYGTFPSTINVVVGVVMVVLVVEVTVAIAPSEGDVGIREQSMGHDGSGGGAASSPLLMGP